MTREYSIGIDLGGTKISGIILGAGPEAIAKIRVAAPKENYSNTLNAIRDLIGSLEQETGSQSPLPVGIGVPGSISPKDNRLQNANSVWLNGKPLLEDLQAALGRPVRLANDANCFAISEFTDGAGMGAKTLFGVIIGTGCGGGIVRDGNIVDGPRGIGGEWGHNPLPWPTLEEVPGPKCWCGLSGCLEAWISGPGLEADYFRATGNQISAKDIAVAPENPAEKLCLDRHASRLARGLASVVNMIDPDIIVLGGGLSNMAHLYSRLPELMAKHIFATDKSIDIRPPVHGDDSGVRGAARLWCQS